MARLKQALCRIEVLTRDPLQVSSIHMATSV
jgi:hypothetical protein